MPRLDTKKKLSQRSERVKAVDLHPTEPWVLTALYTGHVNIWNYQTNELWKSFEVTELPIRAAKFVSRKQWFVTGSDDFEIRVFNYNTSEKVQSITEAHNDYIRDLEVHPSQPWLLSCSDDMTIKLWNWEKNWQCVQGFEGHAHYVMMVKFNPKDSNTFASASLDRSIKVWSVNSVVPNYSLEGHARGVNCIDYYHGGDKPYIISGSDDFTLKVWDYQTKACVSTLEGHANNVSTVAFHPRLPVIISGSEDGTVRLWHNSTYRLEGTLNYGFERCWTIGCNAVSNKVALGFDEGLIVLKLGKETPVASMDKSGRFVITRKNGVATANLRGVKGDDGEKLTLTFKDMGSLESYAHTMKHNWNGRFLVVIGDNEYVIYTALGLRNKSYGTGSDFVWARGSGDYAVRESSSAVKIFKDFKHVSTLKPNIVAEKIFGGTLLAVRGSDSVVFYDWDTQRLIRCIEIVPKNIYWSENGQLVALACEDSYFILQFDPSAVAAAANATGEEAAQIAEEGVESAFELISEKAEKIRSATWVGDVLIYTNSSGRLNYYVGGEVITHAHLEKNLHLLGYLPSEQRVYLMDKSGDTVSYRMYSSALEYQTAVVRRDFETANNILPSIPKEEYDSIARFLEGQGFKEEALQVTVDPDQKFDLALQLNKLEVARDLMRYELADDDTTDSQAKWKQLGDLALAKSDLQLAEECATHGKDYGCLLLIYSSMGNAEGLARIAQEAKDEGRFNVAFIAMFILRRVKDCINLLVSEGRIPEAVLFARTYAPSSLSELVDQWKDDLSDINPRAADVLASPEENPDLFTDLDSSKAVEEVVSQALCYGSFEAMQKKDVAETRPSTGPLFLQSSSAAEKATDLNVSLHEGTNNSERERRHREIINNSRAIGAEAGKCHASSYEGLVNLLAQNLNALVKESGPAGLKQMVNSHVVQSETGSANANDYERSTEMASTSVTMGDAEYGESTQKTVESEPVTGRQSPVRPPPIPDQEVSVDAPNVSNDQVHHTEMAAGSPGESVSSINQVSPKKDTETAASSPNKSVGNDVGHEATANQDREQNADTANELEDDLDLDIDAGLGAFQQEAGQDQPQKSKATEQHQHDNDNTTDEFVDAQEDDIDEFAKELDDFDISDDEGWGV